MKLNRLTDAESADLILYHAQRDITPEDFNMEKVQFSIRHMISLEKVVHDCKGLPSLLLQVAEVLSKDDRNKLYKIVVEKESDNLKGTQAHHKAKHKEKIVYVRRDPDERGR